MIFDDFVKDDLKRMQEWSLDKKIEHAKAVIKEFVETLGGSDKVFVSFSGGKDSTVLLDLVRNVYPDVPGVFFDTGLEFPELVEFAKKQSNIAVRKPRKRVGQVWKEYGIPAVSKESSRYIHDIRNTKSEYMMNLRLSGSNYSLSEKHLHFTDNEFIKYEISGECCNYFKKLPSKDYIKETGKYPIIGTMATESKLRLNSWMRNGCNMFENKIQSRPMSIWTEKDVWEYIKTYKIEICDVYNRGYKRTGCYLCPYGSQFENKEMGTNRFELLKVTHPRLYKSLDKLGLKKVLLDMQVPINNDEEYMKEFKKRSKEIEEWRAVNMTNPKYENYFTRAKKKHNVVDKQITFDDIWNIGDEED